jgi:LPXTG-site transpeptidase (sortase) family protein
MNQRIARRWAERSLVVLGLLLFGLWFRNNTEARAFRSTESQKLVTVRVDAAQVSADLSASPAARRSREPWCPPTLESGVFGRITIPRLGISALIAEGTQPAQLDRAVGHISTTAFPGQPGNCALAGHRDSFLRGLGGVREGDVVLIETLQDTYTYAVQWGIVVGPHQVDVLDSTAIPSLTLVTCYPFHFVGPAPERFVVRARLVEPTTVVGP